jgi:hypothetical protein
LGEEHSSPVEPHEIDGADDDRAGQTLSTPFWGEGDVMARFLDF